MTPDEPSISEETSDTESKSKKPPKRGIIYLSSLPPYTNVTRIREIFGEFGTVGRVYLQLADKGLVFITTTFFFFKIKVAIFVDDKPGEKKSKKKKIAKKFTEGWVEFERKSVAKKVAQLLNNQQVSTRKNSKQYDSIWNIKYLSGFKWTHLHERLAYERAARSQKIRTEVQQAKKKTSYFSVGLDKQKKKKSAVNKELKESIKAVEKESSGESTKKSEDLLTSMFNDQ